MILKLLLICLLPICVPVSEHLAAGNLSLLEEQLKTANAEAERARMAIEKGELETERAQMRALNISIQINATKLQQRITELERELAKQKGQQTFFRRVAVNQHLVTSGNWSIQAGGLKAKKTAAFTWAHVRANRPFPAARAGSKDKLLYYFEVTFTEMGNYSNLVFIGLCDGSFPFTSTNMWVGAVAGSFAMRKDGYYLAPGTSKSGFTNGTFTNEDVVGCGLLDLPKERRLFFTKNGEIWMKPILLGAEDAKANLYPIVTARQQAQVEFNFGADLAAKPFKCVLSQLNMADA